MQILPVIDLMGGVVVRGVAGRRDEYQPVVSQLAEDPRPLTIARGLRDRLGLHTFYLADLDAIETGQPHWQTCRELSEDGFALWIDAGLRDAFRAEQLQQAGAAAVIAGLETINRPELLTAICRTVGSERVIFSLDLKEGVPLGDTSGWGTTSPLDIAAKAIDCGVRRMIVLDLAAVGVESGPPTIPLCREIRRRWPDLELITGGGIRGLDDLITLQDERVDGVLVATALHNGRIGRTEIETLRDRSENP